MAQESRTVRHGTPTLHDARASVLRPRAACTDTFGQQPVSNFRVAEYTTYFIAPAAVRKSSPMTSRPDTDPANLFTLDLPAEWRLERPEQGPIRMACLAPESVQAKERAELCGRRKCRRPPARAPHHGRTPNQRRMVTLCRLQLRVSRKRRFGACVPMSCNRAVAQCNPSR